MGRTQTLNHVDDAELAERAASGDNTAFAELYRRHADTAFRVAYAVTSNKEDAADAVSDAFTKVLLALGQGRLEENASVRAYLLTAARRAGIDALRKRGRSERGDVTGYAAASAGPTEKLLDAADSALVAAAFRGLPERWRSVLWLTEVEQIPAKEAAPLLGLSPNGVAQLAVRARNGLRERYLQAHLRDGDVPSACKFTVDRLGAYVAGALPPRDLAKVDQHLAGCEPCRERHEELEDLGGRLRRIIVPLPFGLGAAAWKNWKLTGGFSPVGRVRELAGALANRAERPLAVLSAGTLALGLVGLGVVGRDDAGAGTGGGGRGGGGAAGRTVTTAESDVMGRVGFDTVSSVVLDVPAEDVSSERRGASLSAPEESGADGVPYGDDDFEFRDSGPPPGDGDGDDPDDPPPPPSPTPAAQFQVTVSGGAATLSIAAGQGEGSCTGGTLGGQSAGCTPPAPDSDAVITVQTGGQNLPAQEIELP